MLLLCELPKLVLSIYRHSYTITSPPSCPEERRNAGYSECSKDGKQDKPRSWAQHPFFRSECEADRRVMLLMEERFGIFQHSITSGVADILLKASFS